MKFLPFAIAFLFFPSIFWQSSVADDKPRLELPHQINVIAVAFPRNKKEMVTVGTQKEVSVRRWNLQDGKLISESILETETHGNRILMGGSALSPDGTLFAANEKEGLAIWSASTGEKLALLKTPNGNHVGQISFSEDSKLLVGGESAGLSGIRLDVNGFHWDVSKVHTFVQMSDRKLGKQNKFILQAEQAYLFPGALQIHHVAISAKSNRIALASQENGIALFDSRSGDRLKIVSNDNSKKKHPKIEKVSPSVANQVLSVSFSPNGKTLATTDMFGVKIRKTSDGSIIHDMEKPFRYGRSRTIFSNDGRKLMRYKTDKLISIWEVESGKEIKSFKSEGQSAAFSRNGEEIGVGFSDRLSGVKVFELPTKK